MRGTKVEERWGRRWVEERRILISEEERGRKLGRGVGKGRERR